MSVNNNFEMTTRIAIALARGTPKEEIDSPDHPLSGVYSAIGVKVTPYEDLLRTIFPKNQDFMEQLEQLINKREGIYRQFREVLGSNENLATELEQRHKHLRDQIMPLLEQFEAILVQAGVNTKGWNN